MEYDGFLDDPRMLLARVEEWGVWSEEVVEGVESWESLDIRRRALVLVEEDVEELLV